MKQPQRLVRVVRRFSPWAVLVALVGLAIPACRVTDLAIWDPPPAPPDAPEVERIRDVPYGEGAGPDSSKRQLDLFLPRGLKDYPVVLLVHGGFWMTGDNRCCGLYPSVASFLARHGLGIALPNYRLSPGVKHPEHIKDVARAFAWVHAHIAEYGGCPDKMVVAGHSAGGHLVTLLATDETWLKAEGLRPTDIKGVIATSGVYHIPEAKQNYALGGSTPQAYRLNQTLPIRRPSSSVPPQTVNRPGIPVQLDVFGPIFGSDPEVRANASPFHHIHPGLPPFLICYADHDLPSLPGMAEEFHQALRAQGCECQLLKVENRNHNSIMFRAIEENDPVGRAMLEFIRGHLGESAQREIR
jgi:acetyl esterase/lipase